MNVFNPQSAIRNQQLFGLAGSHKIICMSLDIGEILKDWPYEPGQVTARRVRGDDGKDKIQLRLDLGLLQMEAVGRPDGQRPHGLESLLDYYEQQLAAHKAKEGGDSGFALDEQACDLLRSEGVMYYHRYLAEFVLEDFEAVQRDTERNLCLMDFCSRYAAEESDRVVLEQYRAYVLMMNARARSRRAIRDNHPKAALAAVRKGIGDIEEFYRGMGQDKLLKSSGEIAVLRVLAREIEASIPVDPANKLRQDLARAVREERYEDAAAIRDQLQREKTAELDAG
jgi:hypothetical protein